MSNYSLGHGEVMMERFKQRAITDGSRFIEPVIPSKGVIVDIGCGNGALASWVANTSGRLGVFAVDQDLHQLTLVNPTQPNLSYIESNADALPFASNSVDLVYLHAVCMYLNPLSTVLEECYRILKTGGKIALRNGLSVVNNMGLFIDETAFDNLLNHSLKKNVDNPNVAFTIPSLLNELNFLEVSVNTSIESSKSHEEIQQVANSTIELLDGKIGQDALQYLKINSSELESLKLGITQWSRYDKAYNKAVWLEHIYIKGPQKTIVNL